MSTIGWIIEGVVAGLGLAARKLGIKKGPNLKPIPDPHGPWYADNTCTKCGTYSEKRGAFERPYCMPPKATIED